MDDRVVGQLAPGPQPHALPRGPLPTRPHVDVALDMSQFDRPPSREELRRSRIQMLAEGVGQGGDVHRVRRGRHRVLVVQALRGLLERAPHRQDGPPVLHRLHATGRKRRTIPDPLDDEPDRVAVVAAADEVGVQRVDRPGHSVDRVDGARRRDE